jgi:hypothetical protein
VDISQIREFYNRDPIRPFVIRTASGDSHVVRHPENMLIDAESGVVILADGMVIIPISSIVEIVDA